MKIDIVFYDLEKKAGIQRAISTLLDELILYPQIELRLILFKRHTKFSFEIPACVKLLFIDIPEKKSKYRLIQLFSKLIWFLKSRNKVIAETRCSDLVVDMGTIYGLLSNSQKVVLYRHFDPFINAYNQAIFRVMKFVSGGKKEIIVLCDSYKKKLVSCGYNKVHVIGNFASNTHKEQIFKDESTVKFLIVGRYSKQKNQKFIVEALNKRKDSSVIEVSFYGEGDCRKIQSQLRTSDGVKFNGPVDSPYDLIDGNTIVISASKYEGLPIFILEALNAGAILVCSDIPEHKDMLGSDFYGYYESNNLNSFNKVLDKIILGIHDNYIRKNYFIANKKILSRFTKEGYSRQVSNFLTKRNSNE